MRSIVDDRGSGETAERIDDTETPRSNVRTQVWAHGPALLARASVLSVAALGVSGLLEGGRWEIARELKLLATQLTEPGEARRRAQRPSVVTLLRGRPRTHIH